MRTLDVSAVLRLRMRLFGILGAASLAGTGCERSRETIAVAREPKEASSIAPSASAGGARDAGGPALRRPIRVGRVVCVPAEGTEGARTAESAGCGDHPGSQVWAPGLALPCGPCAFTIDPEATTKQRAVHDNACCYTGTSPSGPGRALRPAAGVLPAPLPRADWTDGAGERIDLSRVVDARVRDAARLAWLDAAALEHASVATFARLSLELLALGSPPSLVADAHAAAQDEIRHATSSYAIASTLGAHVVGPGALAAGAAPLAAPTLERIASEALLDGCFGETLASLMAAEGAARAEDPALQRVLDGIAEDEARHAELAWRILAWALASSPSTVAPALEAALTTISVTAARRRSDLDLSTLGFVSRADENALRAAVLGGIVEPCLRALIDS